MKKRVLLLIVALVFTAQIVGQPLPVTSTPEELDLIQPLLDSRSKAVNERDEPAFLATVDETSSEFFEAQRSWFRRISALPITDYSLRFDLEESPLLTRARDRERWGPTVHLVVVEERFKIEGFDRLPALNLLFLTFVSKEIGSVRISSDSDVSDLGLNSARQPWDFGDVTSTTSERFMVLAHPSDANYATSLLGLAESAMDDVDRVWQSDWFKRVVIFVPANRQELEKLLDTTVDVSNFVAFAASSVDRRDAWTPGAARIILNRENFARFTPQGQRSVFAHELLHVATRESAGPFLSLAVEEGIAQLAEPPGSVATPLLRRQVDSGSFTGKLPEDVDFVSGSASEISLAYQASFSALEFLRKRLGDQRLNEFYKKLGGIRIEAGTSRFHLDKTLREISGVGLEEFQHEWAASLGETS